MDQGVISALKRIYILHYLDKVLAVLETEEDEVENNRGDRTITNVKAYTIRSAIFNFAYSWNSMKVSTLSSSWKKLLIDTCRPTDKQPNFEGFEAEDIYPQLRRAAVVVRRGPAWMMYVTG